MNIYVNISIFLVFFSPPFSFFFLTRTRNEVAWDVCFISIDFNLVTRINNASRDFFFLFSFLSLINENGVPWCNLILAAGFGYAPIRFNGVARIVLSSETLLFTVHPLQEIFFLEQSRLWDDKKYDGP